MLFDIFCFSLPKIFRGSACVWQEKKANTRNNQILSTRGCAVWILNMGGKPYTHVLHSTRDIKL